jgi:hypothetical protein
MHFLNPIWLLSGFGIIVPIAIHFWNQRPGKMLEIGTVRFLEPNTTKRSSRLQLTEILLLILRCLLILLLSCFLAKPIWSNKFYDSNKGWLIIPAGYSKEAHEKYPKLIDSLLQVGYEFHLMEKDFPSSDFKKSLEGNTEKRVMNYWDLGLNAQQIAPSNISLWIFTPNILSGYKGERPSKMESVKWFGFPVKTDSILQINSAYQLSNDTAIVQMSNASRIGLGFQKLHLSIQHNKETDFHFFDSVGNTYLQYQKQKAVILDRSILQVTIYTDQYQKDAEFLLAAVKSIGNYSGRNQVYKLVNRINDIPKNQDWLFWLSNQTPIQGTAKNILYYQQGAISNLQVNMYQTNESINNSVWEDGFGNSLLQRDSIGKYLFKTHFNPEWNNLVWTKEFPVWVMNLLYPEAKNQTIEDLRQIDAQQIFPMNQVEKKTIIEQSNNLLQDQFKNEMATQKFGNDISWLLWLLTCILFAIERIVALYQAKNIKHA